MRATYLLLTLACVGVANSYYRHLIPEGLERDLRSIHFTDSENGTGQDVRGGLWATQDGGESWKRAAAPKEAVSLADTAYKAAAGAVFKTVDGGKTWNNASVRIDRVFFSAVAAPSPGQVFAVGTRGALLKTTDGGRSWNPVESGTGAWLHTITFADAEEGYAAGDSGIIIKTVDGGATWERQESGTIKRLSSVSCPHTGTCFFVGTGVFLKSSASINMKQPFVLGQSYGMEDAYTFWYQLHEKSPVNIALFDTRGKKAIQLVDGFHEPGRRKLSLQNRKLPSGRYFLVVKVGPNKARHPVDLL